MDEQTTQLIKEKFDSLPESIKEIILSSDYEETLLEIGKQYNLKVDQLGVLERETTLVMMGLTPTKDFENELTRELNVDKIKGSQIVKDVNEKVFLKIRDLLKLMSTPDVDEPSPEKTEKEKDRDILKSAGIEIIPDLPAVPSAQLMQAGKLELNSPHPILTEKLSGFVKNNVAETDHSIENITKETKTGSVKADVPKKVDPYREIPE